MAKPNLKDFDRVLIVEGASDLYFYAEFLEYIFGDERVFIKPFNGKEDLEINLETFINPALLESKSSVGVIVDADSSLITTAATLSSTLSRITRQNVTVGSWTTGSPRIGLYVTPDCRSTGEIETLVWNAWAAMPENAKKRDCILNYVQCMSNSGAQAKSPDKGLVNAFLAIENDEDPRLGPGARSGCFDFSVSRYDPLRSFLAQI